MTTLDRKYNSPQFTNPTHIQAQPSTHATAAEEEMIKEQRAKIEGQADQYRINEEGNIEDQDGQEYDEIDTNVIID